MRDPTLGIRELARGQHLIRKGAHGEAELLPAANLALGDLPQRLSFFEEVLGTFLVDDVEQGAADDQKDHQNDVCLHDLRVKRKVRGERRERIACEH